MKIVADPNIPFVKEAFESLGQVVLVAGRQITPAAVREAELLLVRSVTPVNAALLDTSAVKFVATATIGTDHIDEPYLMKHGIGFASAAGSNANSVAEYVIAALLELAHQHGFRLRNKTLGVIGVGNVGAKVVRYARALDMRVLENDPPRERAERRTEFVTLERLLAEADLVTTHVPLTRNGADATHHLLAGRRLDRFIVINTARGAVVDNAALLQALQSRRLPAAVLDVWEDEPNIARDLLGTVALGTPHIAGYSFDGKVNGTRLIYEAACRHLGIQPVWTPQLPAPRQPVVNVAGGPEEEEEDLLRSVIREVYDIRADDAALRRDPARFDALRAVYPVRREFFNTTVRLGHARPVLERRLAALGFQAPATPTA